MKLWKLVLCLCIMAMLTACAGREGVNPYFQAEVLELGEGAVLAAPLKGETEGLSADQIWVSTDLISENPLPELEVGTRIQVVYNGKIAESYPAQISQVFAIYRLDADGEPIINGDEEAQSTASKPTGYPSDEIGRITLYVQGTRYWYTGDGFDQPLEPGFEKAGEVVTVNNESYQDEEFCGSRVQVGQEVYINAEDDSKIYVRYDQGYGAFWREEEEKEEINALFLKHAAPGWTILDSVAADDRAFDWIGVVLYEDTDAHTVNVGFLKADGPVQRCGFPAQAAETPDLAYLGNGTVTFRLKAEDGTEYEKKVTGSADGNEVVFRAEG